MKNCLYSHLYLQLKSIFTLKKSFPFANLLIQKPDNWFAIVKIKKITWRNQILIKGSTSLLKNSLWDSFQFLLVQISLLFSPWEKHRLLNEFFDTINGLKISMGYTKWLSQLKHGVLFHLKTKNLELFVNY